MPANKLKQLLESHKIEYKTIEHPPVYTAQEIAATAHIPGDALAKTVMVKLNGELAMAVLPASYRIDFDLLCEAAGAQKATLATEQEFKDKFPDCEVGAMPPFGNLYGMEVYVSDALSKQSVIAFCAGTHTELIQLSYRDFTKLAAPKVVKLTT